MRIRADPLASLHFTHSRPVQLRSWLPHARSAEYATLWYTISIMRTKLQRIQTQLAAYAPYPLALQSLIALVLIATPFNALVSQRDCDPFQFWSLTGVMLLHLLVCFAVPIQRLRGWQQLAVLVSQGGLVALAYIILPVPMLAYVLLAIVFQAIYLFRPWIWIPFACLVWLSWSGTLMVVTWNLLDWLQRNLTLAFPATCMLIAAILYSRQHHRRIQVQQLVDQMQQHYDALLLHLRQAQQQATLEERHRLKQTIATDISVALADTEQRVIATIGQAQTNLAKFQDTLAQTRLAASAAIERLRGAVATLRRSQQELATTHVNPHASAMTQPVDDILTRRLRNVLTWILPFVFVALALPLALLQQPFEPVLLVKLLLFCGILVALYIFTHYFRHPLLVQAGLTIQVLLILTLVMVTQTMPLLLGMLLVMWQIALRLSLWQILATLISTHMSTGVILVRVLPHSDDYSTNLLVVGVACATVVGLVGMARRQFMRRRADELRLSRLTQLMHTIEQQEAEVRTLAIAAERTRLARELHDDLGYRLVLINLQLQLAEDLIDEAPDTALEHLVSTREQISAAWASALTTVESELLLDETSLAPAIHALIQPYQARGNPQIELTITGSLALLPVAVTGTIYRTVQEGLTNASKYANASRISIQIICNSDSVQVHVIDDGCGMASPDRMTQQQGTNTPGQFGLAGLRERAALLGGRLASRSLPEGGFALRLTLPLPETTA